MKKEKFEIIDEGFEIIITNGCRYIQFWFLIYKLKLKRETMEKNRIKRFNENSESDVRSSKINTIKIETSLGVIVPLF